MLTLIALSAALMQQAPVPPAPPEVHARVMFMGTDGPGSLDKDGDGQITREEFTAPMNDHFARMDANGDGRLSTGEMSASHGAMADGEHDVRIMRGPGGPGMRRFEFRRDGEAGSHAEYGEDGPRDVRIMRGPGGHAGPDGERTMVFVRGEPGAEEEREIMIVGGPGGPGAEWMGRHAEGGPGERIEIRRMSGSGGGNDLDADNDGRISEAEFNAPLREAFARMDADHSGFIEAGERGGGHGSEVFVHRVEIRSGDED